MTRPTVFKKILLAMLLLSLLPLLVSSFIITFNLGDVRKKLADKIAMSADLQASESLKLRTELVAENISDFLKDCESDLRLLASLPHTPEFLKTFYDSRKGDIWYRRGPAQNPREIREWIPHYASLATIDTNGRETFVIRNGRVLPKKELRDVSIPANTEFRSEEYFARTRRLQLGEIYVSHLTGFHVSKEEQLAGAKEPEEAFGGKEYRGVIRFATPLFDANGRFIGIVVLSLDHRHLMEFSQHILPGKNTLTVFPSYKSGNYAFIFDDEGWIITHPKFWNIRGVDQSGKLLPPYSVTSTQANIDSGRIPFNLDFAEFVHPNYPQVARLVREKKSGYVDVTNVGGATKLMAFAPIRYSTGDYAKHGIFGAVTIGFQVDQFHEMARVGASFINRQLREHLWLSALILATTSLLVMICTWLLSRGITRPLALLTNEVRRVAGGDIRRRVEVASRDELGELAENFNQMTEALWVRLRASELMSRTLDLQVITDDLLELLLKESGLDLAVIRLVNEQGELTVRSFKGITSRVIFETGWEPKAEPSIGAAFLANKPQWVNDTRQITEPASKELIEREGIKSFAHIPIAHAGKFPQGVLSIFSQSDTGLFTEPFLNLLASLAGQLGQAVKIVSEMEAKEQERRQKEEALLKNAKVVRDMEIAKHIQHTFLPSAPPKFTGSVFACRCLPAAHVGGDYYDFFHRNENILDIVIADVSGHSVGAALIMAETRSVLRAVVQTAGSAKEILNALNNLLYDDLTNAELFITMAYVKYDAVNRQLIYTNAGHIPPLLFRNGMTTCTELDAEGLILGVKRGVVFEEKTFQLQQSDILLLYTDGITEAQNEAGEFFGSGRLCDLIAANHAEEPEAIIDTVLKEVQTFTRSLSLNDDISMVVMKVL